MRPPVALLMVVVLGAHLVTAATVPDQDLAIASVRVVGHPPGWENGQATDTKIRVPVENRGTAPVSYRIEYFWIQGNVASPLNGAPERSFNVSSRPIWPGITVVHIEDWHLQPGQVGAGQVEARVHLTSGAGGQAVDDEQPSNDVARTDVFVYQREATLEFENVTVTVPPDGTGFVRFAVHNQGNEPLTARLAARPAQDERLHPFVHPAQVTVPAQSNVTAALYVDFRPEGVFAPFSEQFDVEADVGFGTLLARSPAVHDAAGGDLSGYAFTLEAPLDDPHIAAGAQRTIVFTIANQGSRADNYTFTVVHPDGWAVIADAPRAELRAGEQREIALKVRSPDDALAGETGRLHLRVRGFTGVEREAEILLRATGPAPVIAAVETAATPYVHAPVSLRIVLENAGDEPTPGGTPLSFAIPSGTSSVLWHEASVPAIAAGATHELMVVLPALPAGATEVRATWSVDTVSEATHEVYVHAPQLRIDGPTALTGVAGETVAYRNPPYAFRITNTGNAAEEFVLTASSDAGDAEVEGPQSVLLAPGTTRTVPVVHKLPRPTSEPEARLTLDARVGEAFHWAEQVRTAIADTSAPRIDMGDLPTVWNLHSRFRVVAAIEDDDRVADANATWEGPDGVVYVLSMQRNGTAWEAEFTPWLAGAWKVTVAANDPGGNAAAAVPHGFVVQDIPPPRIQIVSHGNLTPGGAIELRLDDARPIVHAMAVLEQDGLVLRRGLQLDGSVATVSLADLRPETARLVVTARNDAGAQGIARATLELVAPAESLAAVAPEAKSPAPLAGVLVVVLAACWRQGGRR